MAKKCVGILLTLVALLLLPTCGRDFSRFPSKGSYNLGLTSVEPSQGANSEQIPILLRGTNFTGTPQVLVGATYCTDVERVTDKLINAMIPAETSAGIYDITLIGPNQEQATLADAFTIIDPTDIAVISISPNTGADTIAVPVEITGDNFLSGAVAQLLSATLEDAVDLTSVVVRDAQTIDAVVPSGLEPGLYDLTVTNPNTSTPALLTDAYEVITDNGLSIVSVDPECSDGIVDTTITITGTGFENHMNILLGGNDLTETGQFISETEYAAVVPADLPEGSYRLEMAFANDTGFTNSAVLSSAFEIDADCGAVDDDDDTTDDDDDTTDDDDDDTTDDDDDSTDDDDDTTDDDDDSTGDDDTTDDDIVDDDDDTV